MYVYFQSTSTDATFLTKISLEANFLARFQYD